MEKIKSPGKGIKIPENTNNLQKDENCPFTGSLKLRGKSFIGTVVSTKMQRTAVVSWDRKKFLPKYERYLKLRTKVSAHNSEIVNAKEGDIVELQECRPISKTKHFAIVKILGKEDTYELDKRLEEEGKHKFKKKEIENKKDEEQNEGS